MAPREDISGAIGELGALPHQRGGKHRALAGPGESSEIDACSGGELWGRCFYLCDIVCLYNFNSGNCIFVDTVVRFTPADFEK